MVRVPDPIVIRNEMARRFSPLDLVIISNWLHVRGINSGNQELWNMGFEMLEIAQELDPDVLSPPDKTENKVVQLKQRPKAKEKPKK